LVKLEEAVIARLETRGERYEILVDPDLAQEAKRGKVKDLSRVLAVETIFKDAKKGERASEEAMEKTLGTADPLEASAIILKKGEIQLTTEQRRRILDDRRRQIVTIIARNGINPQTGAPHPPQRIERAMEEAKVHVDLNRTVEEQVPIVLKAIRPLLPIRFEKRTLAVKIPAQYAAKAHAPVKGFGEIQKEEWQQDGSWIFLIELPAGRIDEFLRELNSLTRGDVETKILEKKT
jgi:ribosome maturation protein SDO1